MENFFGHLHNCCQMQAVVTLDSLKPFSQWEKVYKSNGLDLMVLMSCIAKEKTQQFQGGPSSQNRPQKQQVLNHLPTIVCLRGITNCLMCKITTLIDVGVLSLPIKCNLVANPSIFWNLTTKNLTLLVEISREQCQRYFCRYAKNVFFFSSSKIPFSKCLCPKLE